MSYDKDFNIEDLLNSGDTSNGIDFKNLSKPKVNDNQLLLPSGKIITFNDEQYEGIIKIREWLKNDKTFFLLCGSAGTGKSTCIKKILDEYKWGVVVSAPTHKALGVIENFTGCKGKTLHSLLGLKPDIQLDAFDPNQPVFSPIVPSKINEYNLIIIDECSMINNELFNLIKKKVNGHKTKILFVGDDFQIPPIKEQISVIFIEDDIEK